MINGLLIRLINEFVTLQLEVEGEIFFVVLYTEDNTKCPDLR